MDDRSVSSSFLRLNCLSLGQITLVVKSYKIWTLWLTIYDWSIISKQKGEVCRVSESEMMSGLVSHFGQGSLGGPPSSPVCTNHCLSSNLRLFPPPKKSQTSRAPRGLSAQPDWNNNRHPCMQHMIEVRDLETPIELKAGSILIGC